MVESIRDNITRVVMAVENTLIRMVLSTKGCSSVVIKMDLEY
jgi:hypothetical protein